MTDGETGYNIRRAATEQARLEMPRDPRRIKALEKILWHSGYPAWQKTQAVDDLIAYDQRAFRDSLGKRFGLLKNWDTINYIFNRAVEENWSDFTPVAVRNYARLAIGIADADRTERIVIQKLNPGKLVEQVILEVFIDAGDEASFLQQVAAWELLVRLQDRPTLLQHIAQAPDTSALVLDLKAAAAKLNVLAMNKEGVLWLQYLRNAPNQSFWNDAVEAVGRLTDEQKTGLELRHLALVIHAEPSDLAQSRDDLVGKIDQSMRRAEHHLKGPTFDGASRDWPQKFAAYQQRLAWADLLAIDVIQRAMQDRARVAQFFDQAEHDRDDISSEHGGILAVEAGRVVAAHYAPRYRRHDRKFIPPPQMITRLYTSLAHYHFHAQEHRNTSYAGPGLGDLRFANNMRATCIVLTFIDRDRLNVDYYLNGRIVVDLGTIRR